MDFDLSIEKTGKRSGSTTLGEAAARPSRASNNHSFHLQGAGSFPNLGKDNAEATPAMREGSSHMTRRDSPRLVPANILPYPQG